MGNLNFVEGEGISIQLADNPAMDATDVNIAQTTLDTAWMPLTTVVAGVPELVWDSDDSLIATLLPLLSGGPL